jgi:plastocyanin
VKFWVLLPCALCLLGAALGPAVTSNVSIRSTGFSPAVDTISVNDTVRWTNLDTAARSSSSRPGSADDWDSGSLGSGSSYLHQFTQVGTFRYQCTETGAQGTIVVISQSPVRASTWGQLKRVFRYKSGVSGS